MVALVITSSHSSALLQAVVSLDNGYGPVYTYLADANG